MAVLAGIQRRHDAGHETIYIHTSGATHLADDSAGSFRGSTVFDDENPEQLNRLSDKKSRVVDLAILRHRRTLGPNAKIAILTPPVVYGVGEGSGRLSIQLPTLVRYSLNHGYAGQIGRGLSVWNHIHVKDLARGYMEILKWMQKTPGNDVQMNPWWFCENGEEISWNECSSAVGEALYRIGLISDPLPQTVPSMNYGELFGDYSETVLGSNSRNRASRLRKLGWKPQEKTNLASLVEDEIPVILKNVPVLHKK